MNITLEKAEQSAKWGHAGFNLVLAVLSVISLAIGRHSSPAEEEK